MAGLTSPSASPARAAAHGARGRRAARALALAAAAAGSLLASSPAAARAEGREDRPWGRGVQRPTFGLSPWGLFNQDVASLSFGLGFNYFIVNGLSVGLGLSDTIFIYRSAFKARYPGIERSLPTNMLEVTPTLQYVFFRSRRFSPYVYGGVGPVFFNHGAGTYGQWVGGPGAYFNLAGPLYVSVGVGFSGLFPTGRCQDALTHRPADPMEPPVQLDLCTFRWGPQVGLTLAFGGGARGRERRQERRSDEPRPQPTPPASNPLEEAASPDPTPVEPAPPPERPAEPAAAIDEGAPSDDATPELEPTDAPPPTDEPVGPPPPEDAPSADADATSPAAGAPPPG